MQYLLPGRVWPEAMIFFFFNKSENAKEISCKVELQSIKIQASGSIDPAPVQELGSEIRCSQVPTQLSSPALGHLTEFPWCRCLSATAHIHIHAHIHVSEDFSRLCLEALQNLAP